MTIVTKDTPLAAIVISEPSIIPVINRLGISLEFDDATTGTVAAGHNIDPSLLTSILNTFLSDDYFPENALKNVDLSSILTYLELTDRYYTHFQIPNIERHFNGLIASGTDNSSLTLLRRLFDKAKADLTASIDYDLKVLFPALRRLAAGHTPDTRPDLSTETTGAVEEMLSDLLAMIVKHISGSYDSNLCYATIVAVNGLETDLRKNNRIRNLILIPGARRLMDSI